MTKVIITEKQFKKLIETGAANAAMDLDIYVQPVNYDTSNGNENLEDSLEEILQKLKELKSMFAVGKKIEPKVKGEIFNVVDDINSIFNVVKQKP